MLKRAGLSLAFASLLLCGSLRGGIAQGQCGTHGCASLSEADLLKAPQSSAAAERHQLSEKARRLSESAIVVIDMQNDFAHPNGTFAKDHSPVIGSINELLDLEWGLRVFTADNHPHNHVSFARSYRSDKETYPNSGFDIVRLSYTKVTANKNAKLCGAEFIERYGEAADVCDGTPQPNGLRYSPEATVLQETYPAHCVQGTWGQRVVDSLKFSYSDPNDHLILKGQSAHIDSYSAIFSNLACAGDGKVRKDAASNVVKSELCIPQGPIYPQDTNLPDLLRLSKVRHVYFVGLCKDYCVKYSSMHSAFLGKQFGWKTYVVEDAAEFCNPAPFHQEEAIEQMLNAGVELVKSVSVKP